MTTADDISAVTAALEQSNNDAALRAERLFEEQLADYIANPKRLYAFGGIVNLLSTIADVMRSYSEDELSDFWNAADLIEDCAKACDLEYVEEE